jgi:hypothetical protein
MQFAAVHESVAGPKQTFGKPTPMSASGGRADAGRGRRGFPLLTHLYGPAVRCKPNLSKWRGLVLRICIRPLHRAFVLLAIMDIRAHPISFSERP